MNHCPSSEGLFCFFGWFWGLPHPAVMARNTPQVAPAQDRSGDALHAAGRVKNDRPGGESPGKCRNAAAMVEIMPGGSSYLV